MSNHDDATGSQIRGSTLLLVGQIFAVIANLGAQILIVRYLSQESYGLFAYALSVMLVAETAAGFGMRRGVSRYMPLYEERGQAARSAGTLLLAAGTVAGIGLVVVLIVVGLRDTISGPVSSDSAATTVLVTLIALAPIQALSTLLDGVFAVYSRPGSIALRKYVLIPTFRLLVVGLMIFEGLGVVFLAGGWVVTALVGLMIYVPLLNHLLREHGLLRLIKERSVIIPSREVLGFTLPLLSNDMIGALMTSGGAVILGLLAAVADVAEFRAVLPVVLSMSYVLSSFGLLLIPAASRMYANSDAEQLNLLYWRTAAWTGVLAFPIFIACVAVPEPITVLLFGETYRSAAPVLAALAVGQFINAAAGHNGALLAVFGRTRFLALTNLVAVPITLGLMISLSATNQAIGAAVATSASLALLNLVRQIGLARHTSISGLDPTVLPTYVAMVGVTAVIVATNAVADPASAVRVALGAGATLVVLVVARQGLALTESFPQLARYPLLTRMLGGQAVA